MKRELQEIEIEGTVFQFDIDRIALIEKKNPSNYITFEHMRDQGTHYSFEYSAVHKTYYHRNAQSFPGLLQNLQSDTPGVANPAITVEIPRIGIIDPEGMYRKYGCSLQDIEQKSDFEIMVNQDVYNKRLNGELVTIDLAGKLYEVDTKSNSLHPQDGTGEEIFLNDFYYEYYNEDAQVYRLFYDIIENKVVDALREGSEDRTEDRIILEVPHLYTLDPIGANREYGYGPEHGLINKELAMKHFAKNIPWEKTFLADSIKMKTTQEKKLPPTKKTSLKVNSPNKRRGRKM